MKMDLAGTIILLCSCAAGAGGEVRPGPPGPAGPWPAALARGCRSPSLPSSLSAAARLGAGGDGPRSPGRRASASRRQAAAGPSAGLLLSVACSPARPASPCPGPLPPPPGAGPVPPTPCTGLSHAEDRVSCCPFLSSFPLLSSAALGCASPCPAACSSVPRDFPHGPVAASRLPSRAPSLARGRG